MGGSVTVLHVRERGKGTEASLDAADDVNVVPAHTSTGVVRRLDDSDVVVCEASVAESPVEILESVRESNPDVPALVRSENADGELAARVTRFRDTEYVPETVLTADGETVADRVRAVVDRTGAEEASRNALEAELRRVHERVTDAFFALDTEFRFTYANDRAAELLEQSTTDLVGSRLDEVCPQTTETAVETRLSEVMDSQRAVTFEEYVPSLGSWFDVRAYPSTSGLSVYFSDVTDQKRSEETLSLLYETTSDLFDQKSQQDVSRVVVDAATEVLDLTGVAVYRYRDETGMLHPDAESDAVQFMRDELPAVPANDDSIVGDTYETGEMQYLPDVRKSPDLQLSPEKTGMRAGLFVPMGEYGVVVVGSPDVDAFNGRTRRLVSILGTDAEAAYERVERERELEESRRRYRTLVENFPNGVVVFFDDDLRYLVAGGQTMEGANLTTDDLTGKRLEDVLPPTLADELVPRYEAALEGESKSFQVTYGGEVRDFYATPVRDDDGEVFAGLAISQDVTERQKRQEDLASRVAQQEVVAELGRQALTTDDLDELLMDASRFVSETLGTDYAKILEYDVVDDELSLCAGTGWQDCPEGVQIPAELDYQAGYTLAQDSPVIVDDWGTESRFVASDLLTDHDVSSGLSVVVGTPEDPWGVLGAFDEDSRAFSDHDVNFVQNVANVLTSAISRHEHERQVERQRERLAALNQTHTVVHGISQTLARQSTREEIERVVCERLATSESYQSAWIGDVNARREVTPRTEHGVEWRPDGECDEVDGNRISQRAFDTREVQVLTEIQTDSPNEVRTRHAREHGYRSMAAIPLLHEGRLYGVLHVYADRPDAFTGRERDVMWQLGKIAGLAITAVERERELREREVQYRTLVDNIPNGGVSLYDEDLRYTRNGGEVLDELGTDASELVGRRVDELDVLPAEYREQLTEIQQAAIDGQQVDTTIEYDGRIFRVQAMPVYDDDEIIGGMNLSQDITEHKTREEQLEHERERLEFVNRILRHNLLNGLNVATARADILDEWVDPEANHHLDTLQNRLDELVDFVETMRSFMRAVGDEKYRLEPVGLSSVVAEEADKVQDSFENAVVETDVPDVDVEADELLEEVVENLLINAVQHNDTDTPKIRVTGEFDDGTATIRVADNGPGIPDGEKDRMLEKGVKGLASPGTGFGLYLVRETVENYGGSVCIEDNDPNGTVLVLELPRAKAETAEPTSRRR